EELQGELLVRRAVEGAGDGDGGGGVRGNLPMGDFLADESAGSIQHGEVLLQVGATIQVLIIIRGISRRAKINADAAVRNYRVGRDRNSYAGIVIVGDADSVYSIACDYIMVDSMHNRISIHKDAAEAVAQRGCASDISPNVVALHAHSGATG